jgi:hypothetical protein
MRELGGALAITGTVTGLGACRWQLAAPRCWALRPTPGPGPGPSLPGLIISIISVGSQQGAPARSAAHWQPEGPGPAEQPSSGHPA